MEQAFGARTDSSKRFHAAETSALNMGFNHSASIHFNAVSSQ